VLINWFPGLSFELLTPVLLPDILEIYFQPVLLGFGSGIQAIHHLKEISYHNAGDVGLIE